MALNVDNIDVNFFRIKPESLSAFVSQWEYRNSLSNWESDELLKMADLVYTGRFDLNPARNTREKLLLPLADIKPLQEPGVYIAVMNQAAATAIATPRRCSPSAIIGVSAHRYHNRLDVFTQSLENGAAQSGIDVQLLNAKGQTLAQAKSDAQGHVTLQTDKEAALLLARKDGKPLCWISNSRRWTWLNFPSPARRASASSYLCLAHGISIARAKRLFSTRYCAIVTVNRSPSSR